MKKKDVLESADRYIRPRMEVVYAERRKDLFEEYATNDALWTMRLTHLYYKEVKKRKLDSLFWELEMPVVGVLSSMEARGARVDVTLLKKLLDVYAKEIKKAYAAIAKECGEDFNPRSHIQLKNLFWKEMGIEPPQWAWTKANIKKGNTGIEYASTDASVLKWLSEEHDVKVANDLLFLRKLEKMHGTYIEPLLERAIIDPENRIHCSFNPVGTPNDRLSSSDPNLQNIPRPGTTEAILKDAPSLRSAFIPEDGYSFINPDFSQIELRILAHITQDPVLLAAYRHWKCYTCGAEGETDTAMHYCPECWADEVEAKGSEKIVSGFVLGKDIHWETAVATGLVDLYGPVEGRYKAKNVNFGLIYGMFPKLLAKMIKVPLEEAQLIHRRFFLKYERVRAFHLWVEQKLLERGYFTLLNGRRRHFLRERQLFKAGQIPDWKWSGVVREAVNSIIQGGAAILMKYAMRDIHEEINTGKFGNTGIILQVHDELLIESPDKYVEKTAKMVQERMEAVKQLRVPIIADAPIMKAWHEAA